MVVATLPSAKALVELVVLVPRKKAEATRPTIHGLVPSGPATVAPAIGRRPTTPLGVGPRRVAKGLTVAVRPVTRAAARAGTDTGSARMEATLAGIGPAGLNEGPRVPEDVPAPLSTTRRVAETVRLVAAALVLELKTCAAGPKAAAVGPARKAEPSARLVATASVALAWEGRPLAHVATNTVRLAPGLEEAGENIDGLRSPLGVAPARATYVAQAGRPIGVEAGLQLVTPFLVRPIGPGPRVPVGTPEAGLGRAPDAASLATEVPRPTAPKAHFLGRLNAVIGLTARELKMAYAPHVLRLGILPTGRAAEAVRRPSVRLVEPSVGLARAAIVLVATVPLPRSGHVAFLVVVPIQAVLTTGGASGLRVGRVPTTKNGQAAPTGLQTLGTPTDVGVVVRPVGAATVAGLQGLEGARAPLALEAPIGAMGATT